MEAVAQMPGEIPQIKENRGPQDTSNEQIQPKPDGTISRFIAKFRKAPTPDAALHEIANYDSTQEPTDLQNPEQQSGLRDKILGFLKFKNNSNPDAILELIAQNAEALESGEGNTPQGREMIKNAKIATWCIDRMRDVKNNPLGTAAFLVPVAIAAIDKMVGIPLPAEVVGVMPGALGGAMSGVNIAPERHGVRGKAVGAVVGAGLGVGISKGIGHVASGPMEVAAGYVDDGASAVAKPVVKIARRVKGLP